MKARKRIFLGLIPALMVLFVSFFIFLQSNYYPPIIMYHSVGPASVNTPVVSKRIFRKQLEYLRDKKFKVVPLSKIAEMMKNNRVPRRVIAITFDDGYKNNLDAAKVLKEFGFPATIFMIVHNIGKKGYLSLDDLHDITDNTPVSIGAHTLNHRYLPEASPSEQKREIAGSKMRLENMLGVEVESISYPTGGFNEVTLKTVKAAGYVCGVTTNRGDGRSVFALKRVKFNNDDGRLGLWAKLSGFYDVFRKRKNPY